MTKGQTDKQMNEEMYGKNHTCTHILNVGPKQFTN